MEVVFWLARQKAQKRPHVDQALENFQKLNNFVKQLENWLYSSGNKIEESSSESTS